MISGEKIFNLMDREGMPFGTICDILRENKVQFDLRQFILIAFKSPNWNYNNLRVLLERECHSDQEIEIVRYLFKYD